MSTNTNHNLKKRFALNEQQQDDFPTLDDFKNYITTKIQRSSSSFYESHKAFKRINIAHSHGITNELSNYNVGLRLAWHKVVKSLYRESAKNEIYLIEEDKDRILVALWHDSAELAIFLPHHLVQSS